jgi:hypothetical protein
MYDSEFSKTILRGQQNRKDLIGERQHRVLLGVA